MGLERGRSSFVHSLKGFVHQDLTIDIYVTSQHVRRSRFRSRHAPQGQRTLPHLWAEAMHADDRGQEEQCATCEELKQNRDGGIDETGSLTRRIPIVLETGTFTGSGT